MSFRVFFTFYDIFKKIKKFKQILGNGEVGGGGVFLKNLNSCFLRVLCCFQHFWNILFSGVGGGVFLSEIKKSHFMFSSHFMQPSCLAILLCVLRLRIPPPPPSPHIHKYLPLTLDSHI